MAMEHEHRPRYGLIFWAPGPWTTNIDLGIGNLGTRAMEHEPRPRYGLIFWAPGPCATTKNKAIVTIVGRGGGVERAGSGAWGLAHGAEARVRRRAGEWGPAEPT